MRYKLTIEYDGTAFAGWQVQPNAVTVQGELMRAIGDFIDVDPRTVRLAGSGRTDAGVHALGQVAHFDCDREYKDYQIREAINSRLHNHRISVVCVTRVCNNFHARFSAIRRSYRYRILNRRAMPAYDRDRVWHCPVPLDRSAMHEATAYFSGTHDFTSFRALLCQAKNPVRTLEHIALTELGDELHLDVTARAFLHHQVRNIVGTLLWVGKGKFVPTDIPDIFAAKNRAAAGPTAPSEGLCFMSVAYPEIITKNWRDENQ